MPHEASSHILALVVKWQRRRSKRRRAELDWDHGPAYAPLAQPLLETATTVAVSREMDGDGGDEPDNLETCCICLDSLCVSPVVALMADRRDGGCRASCSHFYHSACAARLEPRLCPMCRTPFGEPSVPFGGDDLVAAGATRVIAAARRLQGDEPDDEASPSVKTRTVVELLAASFPIQQAALEAAVADLAVGANTTDGVVASPRSGTKRIGAPGLVQVLARCSSVGLLLHSAPAAAAESQSRVIRSAGRAGGECAVQQLHVCHPILPPFAVAGAEGCWRLRHCVVRGRLRSLGRMHVRSLRGHPPGQCVSFVQVGGGNIRPQLWLGGGWDLSLVSDAAARGPAW